MSSPLTKLASFPFKTNRSNIAKINKYEFVTATQNNQWMNDEYGLYKYDTRSDKWTLLLKYPEKFSFHSHHICYDDKNELVYMYGGQRKMIIFDLAEMKVMVHETQVYVGWYPSLLMMKNECHIILGSNSKFHYKWNTKTHKLDIVFELNQFDKGLFGHGIVAKPQNEMNELLIFGGYNSDDDECSGAIWEYDHECETMTKNSTNLPMEFCFFGWTLSKSGQYLVIFGGEDVDDKRIKNVFIIELDGNGYNVYSSSVEMPNTEVTAISMPMENTDTLIRGFIRKVSIEYDMNIPMELMQIFHIYLDSEMVYLLDNNGELYKIEMHDILHDMHSDLTIKYF